MRGAERPDKLRWTHPFLPPLMLLNQDAAIQTFIDIAEDNHAVDEVNKVLKLTDNLPLAITLMAHLVDLEGCSDILSRWEAERTSLISDGYSKRDNLELSILLSLSSPRIKACPDSRDLLSLLSILPDGISDSHLLQSNLPMKNILGCKAALIRTSLAYTDAQKRLKVLVPIREYMHRVHPPRDNVIQPLLNYFYQLLECYIGGTGGASSQASSQISSNYSNIQNVLQNGFRLGHQDLVNSIYSTCNLNRFSIHSSRGAIPLMDRIESILPQPSDHQLEVYFITELFTSALHRPLQNPRNLMDRALKHLDHLNNPKMECKLYNSLAEYHSQKTPDISTAMKFSQNGLSLSISIGDNKEQSSALSRMARIRWQLGDYAAAQVHACASAKVARICGHLFHEAWALCIEAMCWLELGNTKRSLFLCSNARNLLHLCHMSGADLDYGIMTTLATVHQLKTEFVEARHIHALILSAVSEQQDPYNHGLALLNIASLDNEIGAPKNNVQESIDKAALSFVSAGFVMGAAICEVTMAELYFREENFRTAEFLFEKYLKLSWGHSTEMTICCLEPLSQVRRWGFVESLSKWPTVLLAHSFKSKRKLGIYRALQSMADAFLNQGDEHTTLALFTIALEGYTYMDVHKSRAECMVELGNIFKAHGDLLRSIEFWKTAGELFQRSSQMRQVQEVEEKVAHGCRESSKELV